MRKNLKFIFLAVFLITSTASYGRVEILLLGKTKWLASEICGKQIPSKRRNIGKCEPVFKDYIGIEIISGAAKVEPCISTIEYSKFTNEVIMVNLYFPISEINFIEEVFSSRYGHPTKEGENFRLWKGIGDAMISLDKSWGECVSIYLQTAPMADAYNRLESHNIRSEQLIKEKRLTESAKKL